MIKLKLIFKYAIVLVLFSFLASCYEYPEDSELEYAKYNRVIGPEGGEIVFLSNYGNDSVTNLSVKLDFPAGAVDSNFVFNMYEFEDVELVQKMKTEGLAVIGSKQLYFVPFYESEGYNENGQLDLSYHLSVDFKEPVSVTYNYLDESQVSSSDWEENQLYYEFYKKTTKLYQLYKIKIPRIDEWGDENIFVAWNNQGYPVGYNETHLHEITSGEMSATNPDGNGEASLVNWELVDEFNINTKPNKVTFDIYNTDYIYVLALKIEIDPSKIPRAITNMVKEAFPDATIEKASMDLNDKVIHLYLSNDFIFIVERRANVFYIIKSELGQDEIPQEIIDIVSIEYPEQQIRNVAYNTIDEWDTYTVLLTSGEKMYFDIDKNLTGVYKYGIDPASLPEPITSFITAKFPNQAVVNVTYDAENNEAQAIVYLSNDVKLAFNTADFSLISEVHFHLTNGDIPAEVQAFFDENEPGVQISSIQYYVEPGETGKHFMAELINGAEIVFDSDYSILEYVTNFFPEESLPSEIVTALQAYSMMEVTQISHIFYAADADEAEYNAYDVQLSGGLNIYFEGNSIAFMEGSNFDQVPEESVDFIQSLLPETSVLVFYYYPNVGAYNNVYDFYLNNGVNVSIYNNNEMLYYETENYNLSNLPLKMQEFISTEASGLQLEDFWFDVSDTQNAWNAKLTGERYVILKSDFTLSSIADYDVSPTDLPVNISSYIQNNYPGIATDYFIKQFSVNHNKIVYEILLNNGATLFFSQQGVFLNSNRGANVKPVRPRKSIGEFNKRIKSAKKSKQKNKFRLN